MIARRQTSNVCNIVNESKVFAVDFKEPPSNPGGLRGLFWIWCDGRWKLPGRAGLVHESAPYGLACVSA